MSGLIPGATTASELAMLCGTYEPALHPRRAIVQRKWDGIRCLWINGHLVSREGVPMSCAQHATINLLELVGRFGKPMVFDTEYVAGTFEQTNSAFKRGHMGKGVLHVFDAVPFDHWRSAGRTAPLSARLAALQDAGGTYEHLRIEHDLGNGASTPEETRRMFDEEAAYGGEGVVIKDATSAYIRGRSRAWLKWKAVQTIDARCHTVNTAGGKLRSIGVFLSDGTDVTIGSGWAPNSIPDGLLGGTVEIAYNGLTSTGALRHARFIRVR